MQLNSIVFPAPKKKRNLSRIKKELIWIPIYTTKKQKTEKKEQFNEYYNTYLNKPKIIIKSNSTQIAEKITPKSYANSNYFNSFRSNKMTVKNKEKLKLKSYQRFSCNSSQYKKKVDESVRDTTGMEFQWRKGLPRASSERKSRGPHKRGSGPKLGCKINARFDYDCLKTEPARYGENQKKRVKKNFDSFEDPNIILSTSEFYESEKQKNFGIRTPIPKFFNKKKISLCFEKLRKGKIKPKKVTREIDEENFNEGYFDEMISFQKDKFKKKKQSFIKKSLSRNRSFKPSILSRIESKQEESFMETSGKKNPVKSNREVLKGFKDVTEKKSSWIREEIKRQRFKSRKNHGTKKKPKFGSKVTINFKQKKSSNSNFSSFQEKSITKNSNWPQRPNIKEDPYKFNFGGVRASNKDFGKRKMEYSHMSFKLEKSQSQEAFLFKMPPKPISPPNVGSPISPRSSKQLTPESSTKNPNDVSNNIITEEDDPPNLMGKRSDFHFMSTRQNKSPKFFPRAPSEPKKVKAMTNMSIKNSRLFESLHIRPESSVGRSISVKSSERMNQISMMYSKKISHSVPCTFFKADKFANEADSKINRDVIIVYLHANGEDLFDTYTFCKALCRYLNVNVLGVEYPGYSIYEGEPNEKRIYEDLNGIFYFIQKDLLIERSKVVLVGRSLGTGPAFEFAQKYRIGCMIAISPFKSIKDVVKSMVGRLGQFFVKQRFENIEKAKRVKCPTLIIHGKKDSLVPSDHAKQLYDEIKTMTELFIADNMGHDITDFFGQILTPVFKFLRRIKMV